MIKVEVIIINSMNPMLNFKIKALRKRKTHAKENNNKEASN
jgi:hypothetical protein